MPEPSAPRTVLVGTPASVMSLSAALGAAGHEGTIVGAVTTILPPEPLTLPLLGDLTHLAAAIEEHGIESALLSLPIAMGEQIEAAARTLDWLGVPWRFMPTLADQLAGRTPPPTRARVARSAVVAHPVVDPVQLLNRRSHALDEDAIRRTLSDRVVLITGAGGSIGSELARIVARFGPSKLVLVERGENALFEIDRNIAKMFPGLPRAAILHDVTNAPRTMAVVTAEKPAVIFHAAAHKHVPMMEDHPAEAVENNFYGTRSIADAAARNGVDRFVMISTDKAVNPSSVMGATKRIAELYIQHLNQRSDTNYSMVRFGNVLGSACSVLPIWSQQLAQGHPITVTHPDMSRYFMTIPEAAGLVLQSAALSNTDGSGAPGGGEVFLLDMGEPIKILELARRFIRLQGLEPGVDVPIEFTGIRPGEKLFEELAYDGEDMIPTVHESVRIWRTTPPTAERMRAIVAAFDRMRGSATGPVSHAWQDVSRETILTAIRGAVPEMVPAAERLRAAG